MAKPKKKKPARQRISSSPSPMKYTQFGLFQVLTLVALVLPLMLLEGVNHWQTGLFFAVAIGASFLLRELIWGHGDLLQDELADKDDHESLWLFVFGRLVRNTEHHSVERKRLLRISSSGKKYLIRISIVAMVVLYFVWMRNREAVSFRPSAFLYTLVFALLLSSVFACQFWASLIVAGIITIFATSGEWGPYPLAFAGFLVLLFGAMATYRQSTIEWVYAHERHFKKIGFGPGPLSSVLLVALLAVFSLWILDKVLPDSLRSQKKGNVSQAVDSLKAKIAKKVSEEIVERQGGSPGMGGSGQGAASSGGYPTLSGPQQQGANTLEKMSGLDPETAAGLASSLSPEDLAALGDFASLSGDYARTMGGGAGKRGGSGGSGKQGLTSNRPGMDPEAWQRFMKQLRDNPGAQNDFLKEYPQLSGDVQSMAQGQPPSPALEQGLEEYLKQNGPVETQPEAQQQRYEQLAKKLGMDKEDLTKMAKGQKLDVEQLQAMKKLAQQNRAQSGGSTGSLGAGGAAGVQAGSGSGGGAGSGSKVKDEFQRRLEEQKAKPLMSREERLNKTRMRVEQNLSFIQNILIAIAYLAGVYLLFVIIMKFSGKQQEETKPTGKLTREDRKSLKDEFRRLHSRPLDPQEEVVKSYHLFLRVMELVQYPRQPEISPTRFARDVIRHFPRLREAAPYMSEIFCQVLYGRVQVEAGTLKEFRGHFRKVVRQFGL